MNVSWVCFHTPLFVILVVTTGVMWGGVYIHIGVRLRVARFDEQGNAKASKSVTSNRYRFSRFLFFITAQHAESGGLIGTIERD